MIFDDGGWLKKVFTVIVCILITMYFGFWTILIVGLTIVISYLLEDILFDEHHFK